MTGPRPAAAPPRVLLRLEGGHRWGLGHLMRGRVLASALAERGAAVTFATTAGTEAEARLRAAGEAVLALPAGTLLPDRPDVDVVVVDMLAQGDALATWERGRARLVAVDDRTAHGVADAVINPIVELDAPSTPPLHRGPAYAILPPALCGHIGRHRVRPQSERVLLAFGGSDDHGIAPRMIDLLRALPGPLTVVVNRPPAARYGAALDRAIADHPLPIEERDPQGDFFAALCDADLVLCAGGAMLFELAALGVPSAAVAGEPHERATIASLATLGTTVDLGPHEALGPHVAEAVESLLGDTARRASLSAAGRALVDGRGRERCATIIEDLWS